jgi:hypothetical protein
LSRKLLKIARRAHSDAGEPADRLVREWESRDRKPMESGLALAARHDEGLRAA